MPSRVLLTIASSDEETMAASWADSRAAAEYRSVVSSHGIGATRFICDTYGRSRREIPCRQIDLRTGVRTGMGIVIRPARSVTHSFEIPYCVISDSACRNLPKIVENGRNMLQERLKRHSSPNGGLPAGVRDKFPGEAEGRNRQGQTSRVGGAMRDADVRRVVPLSLKRSGLF